MYICMHTCIPMGVCIPSPTFIHLETKLNSAVPLSLVVYFRDGAVRWWPTEIRCDASRPRMSNNYTVTGVKNHFLVGNAVHSFFLLPIPSVSNSCPSSFPSQEKLPRCYVKQFYDENGRWLRGTIFSLARRG